MEGDEQLRKLVEIDVRLRHVEQCVGEVKDSIRGKDLHVRIARIESTISGIKWIIGFAIPGAIAMLEVVRRIL